MLNLLKTEWLKIKKYRAFWLIIGLTALSYPGINYIFYMAYNNIVKKQNTAGELARVYIGNPFSFPAAWHTIAYFSSWTSLSRQWWSLCSSPMNTVIKHTGKMWWTAGAATSLWQVSLLMC